MGNQSTKDYKFAEKNKWRIWAWRQIKKRLWQRGIKTQDTRGLYLASEGDKDRDIACRRNGFRPENLIAVEKDPATMAKLRAKRVIVVEGDVWDALCMFDRGYIQFANLDFCNGFTNSCWSLLEQSLNTFNSLVPPYHPVCVNLLAGRDATDALEHFKSEYPDAPGAMHRGFMFVTCLLGALVPVMESLKGHKLSKEELEKLRIQTAPSFHEYKSGNVWMHSVVFNMPLTHGHFLGHLNQKGKLEKFFDSTGFIEEGNIPPKKGKKAKVLQAKISAAKAIRTQRLNGTLPPSPAR